jgi:phosphohistidine phosphatase
VRSRQTAEILRTSGLSSEVEESTYLAPGGDINAWLKSLEQRHQLPETLALVGHQPDLGQWAEILIWGEARDKLLLKKAGIIGLTLPKTGSLVGRSQLFWLTPPKFLL